MFIRQRPTILKFSSHYQGTALSLPQAELVSHQAIAKRRVPIFFVYTKEQLPFWACIPLLSRHSCWFCLLNLEPIPEWWERLSGPLRTMRRRRRMPTITLAQFLMFKTTVITQSSKQQNPYVFHLFPQRFLPTPIFSTSVSLQNLAQLSRCIAASLSQSKLC